MTRRAPPFDCDGALVFDLAKERCAAGRLQADAHHVIPSFTDPALLVALDHLKARAA